MHNKKTIDNHLAIAFVIGMILLLGELGTSAPSAKASMQKHLEQKMRGAQ